MQNSQPLGWEFFSQRRVSEVRFTPLIWACQSENNESKIKFMLRNQNGPKNCLRNQKAQFSCLTTIRQQPGSAILYFLNLMAYGSQQEYYPVWASPSTVSFRCNCSFFCLTPLDLLLHKCILSGQRFSYFVMVCTEQNLYCMLLLYFDCTCTYTASVQTNLNLLVWIMFVCREFSNI